MICHLSSLVIFLLLLLKCIFYVFLYTFGVFSFSHKFIRNMNNPFSNSYLLYFSFRLFPSGGAISPCVPPPLLWHHLSPCLHLFFLNFLNQTSEQVSLPSYKSSLGAFQTKRFNNKNPSNGESRNNQKPNLLLQRWFIRRTFILLCGNVSQQFSCYWTTAHWKTAVRPSPRCWWICTKAVTLYWTWFFFLLYLTWSSKKLLWQNPWNPCVTLQQQ